FVIARRLIQACREDAHRPEHGGRTTVRVKYPLSDQQTSQLVLVKELGMREVRKFWTMQVPLDNLEEPQPVDGIIFRHLSVPEDVSASLDAFNDSFSDHYDFHGSTPERWTHRLSRVEIRPDLSWLAEAEKSGGKIAGFCI